MPVLQSTRWCFTINNPTDNDRICVQALLDSQRIRYAVVGREVGDSGTPHLQGFVIFQVVKSRRAVAAYLPRAHLEVARGPSHAAADYCKKENDFDEAGDPPRRPANHTLNDFISWGDQFIQSNGRAPTEAEIALEQPKPYLLYPKAVQLFQHRAGVPVLQEGVPNGWQAALNAELLQDADDRKVVFYVDEEGGKGKSWFQRWFLTNNGNSQVLPLGKRDDVAYAVQSDKSVFFFNVPRGAMEYFPYQILEQLKDQMISSPKYMGITKFLLKSPHVVVFCNEYPDMSKLSADRYSIRDDY